MEQQPLRAEALRGDTPGTFGGPGGMRAPSVVTEWTTADPLRGSGSHGAAGGAAGAAAGGAARHASPVTTVGSGRTEDSQWKAKWANFVSVMKTALSRGHPGDAFHVILKLYDDQDAIAELFDTYGLAPRKYLFYVPQLTAFLLHAQQQDHKKAQLEVFLLDKCERSVDFAHRMYWYLQSFAPDVDYRSDMCGAVCGGVFGKSSLREAIMYQGALASFTSYNIMHPPAETAHHEDDEQLDSPARTIPARPDLFQETLNFVNELIGLADHVSKLDIEGRRNEHLRAILASMHARYLPSDALYMPVGMSSNRLVGIHPEESFCFSSKARVPYLACFEVVSGLEDTPTESPTLRPQSSSRQFMAALKRAVTAPRTSFTPLLDHASGNHAIEAGPAAGGPAAPEPHVADDTSKDGQEGTVATANMGQWGAPHTADAAPSAHDAEHRNTSSNALLAPKSPSMHALPVSKSPYLTAKPKDPQDDARPYGPPPAFRLDDGVLETKHNDDELDETVVTPAISDLTGAQRTSTQDSHFTLHLDEESKPAPRDGDHMEKLAGTSDGGGSERGLLQRSNTLTDEDLERQLEAELAAVPSVSEALAADGSGTATGASGTDTSEIAPLWRNQLHSTSPEKLPRVVFKENWKEKEARFRATSPFGHMPGWRLMPVIVKSRDDLRQEQFAAQLIRQFDTIFRDAGLDLWMRPYDILAISPEAGLIEAVPDTISLHALKKRDPNFTTLNDFFMRRFGGDNDNPSPALARARRNFCSSLAAYSIVCYLLQVKDRHNGNILLTSDGHVLHIDFGFLLGSSPGGNMGFETAPFKLTADMVEVLGGPRSSEFRRFRTLCCQAFLHARKHSAKIILLVQMMRAGNEDLPCFGAQPDQVIAALRNRFELNKSNRTVINIVDDLINQSINNWTTSWYDKYQRCFMGII